MSELTESDKINLFKESFRGRGDAYGTGSGGCVKEPQQEARSASVSVDPVFIDPAQQFPERVSGDKMPYTKTEYDISHLAQGGRPYDQKSDRRAL